MRLLLFFGALRDTGVDHTLAPAARILKPPNHLLSSWPGVNPGQVAFYLFTFRMINLIREGADRTLTRMCCGKDHLMKDVLTHHPMPPLLHPELLAENAPPALAFGPDDSHLDEFGDDSDVDPGLV